MNEIKSHLDDELKGVVDYFSLYLETNRFKLKS